MFSKIYPLKPMKHGCMLVTTLGQRAKKNTTLTKICRDNSINYPKHQKDHDQIVYCCGLRTDLDEAMRTSILFCARARSRCRKSNTLHLK